MVKAMRLHIVRHGESASNADRARISLPPEQGDRLTDLGRRQAREAAPHLEVIGAQKVFCSRLRRAQETAEVIAGELGLDVEVVDDLHEYRDSEGFGELPIEEQRLVRWSIWMAEHADNPGYSLRGAESFADIRARAGRVLDLALAQKTENALFIGHGILTRFIFTHAVFGDSFGPADVPRLWQLGAVNCGLTIFEHGEPDDDTGPAQGLWRCLTWMARPWDPYPARTP